MVRLIIATLTGQVIGVAVALFIIDFLEELLHTKDALVALTVFTFGAGVGCYTAIRLRRLILPPSTQERAQ